MEHRIIALIASLIGIGIIVSFASSPPLRETGSTALREGMASVPDEEVPALRI